MAQVFKLNVLYDCMKKGASKAQLIAIKEKIFLRHIQLEFFTQIDNKSSLGFFGFEGYKEVERDVHEAEITRGVTAKYVEFDDSTGMYYIENIEACVFWNSYKDMKQYIAKVKVFLF